MIKGIKKNINGGLIPRLLMPAGLFRLLLILLPLAFAGNVIYTIAASETDVWRKLSEFRAGYLFLAILLSLLPWLAQSIRIIIWSRVFEKPVKLSQAFRAVLATDIAAAATPTMLGGGYAKAGFLISYGFSAGEAAIITFLGSIVDAVFFAIALPLSIIWCRAWENQFVLAAMDDLTSKWPIVLTVIIALIVILIVIKNITKRNKSKTRGNVNDKDIHIQDKIIIKVRKFKNDLAIAARFVIKKGKVSFLAAIFVAGAGWCARYGAISALVMGLGFSADPVLFFILQWAVFTTMTMVPTPGAIGGAEVSFALIYNGLVPSFAMPVVTTGWRFITFYMPVVLGAFIFSAMSGINWNAKDDNSKKNEDEYISRAIEK